MVTSIKPYQTRASDLKPVWHVIDADGRTLGRLSSEIAVLLQGKHKPIYVPHLNTGDYVIVINAGKFRVTGKKLKQKKYYRHSGYHGGLKEQTLDQLLKKTPTRAIKYAVKGMLPKNILGRRMLSRLKLYAGVDHPHEAQVRGSQRAGAEEATPTVGQQAQAPETTRRRRTKAQQTPEAEVQQAQAPETTPTRRRRTKAQQAPEAEVQQAQTPDTTPTRRRRTKAQGEAGVAQKEELDTSEETREA